MSETPPAVRTEYAEPLPLIHSGAAGREAAAFALHRLPPRLAQKLAADLVPRRLWPRRLSVRWAWRVGPSGLRADAAFPDSGEGLAEELLSLAVACLTACPHLQRQGSALLEQVSLAAMDLGACVEASARLALREGRLVVSELLASLGTAGGEGVTAESVRATVGALERGATAAESP